MDLGSGGQVREAGPKNPEDGKDKGGFCVDRGLIEEVLLEEQDEDIQHLGLSVYRQETLEQGILQQVDEALERQQQQLEEQRLEREVGRIADEVRQAEEQTGKDDNLLRVLLESGAMRSQMAAIKKEHEAKKKHLSDLKARHKALLEKKYSLCTESQDSSLVPEGKQKEETEEERMVRLGEMTPFGTKVSAEMSELDKYLKRQQDMGANQSRKTKKKASPEQKGSSSPLKRSILMPQKRKKKAKLGTKSSKNPHLGDAGKVASETHCMWMDGDDPDFVPSSCEDDDAVNPYAELGRKKALKRKPPARRAVEKESSEEWATDDSEWERLDAKAPRKRRKGAADDGTLEDFELRLQQWKDEKGGSEHEETHKLDGGLEVPLSIWSRLYKYQQVGVQWMWELYQSGTGGVLGDEMGLGKTIQVIAFLAALKVSRLRSKHTGFRGLGPTILACPTTVMHQWVSELHAWWPPIRVAILHDSGSSALPKATLVREINQAGGVLVCSYQGLVALQEVLQRQRWHLLVLDEGHKIRNPDAQATLAAKRVATPHRLALTGSPMQNNLKELWSLFDFVYPSKLGTLPDFMANFAVPITQGGYANASEVQVATAYQCALTLKETLKPYLLRRMKADVKNHIMLPPKNEQVLFCKLTEEQRSLYQQYVNSNLVNNILTGSLKIFVGLINLRKICNHPDLFGSCSKLDDPSLPKEEQYGYWEKSGKMVVIQQLLKIWHKQGHRVLLFTQGRQMMCILESFVIKEGYKYLKLDGSTAISSRQPLIAEFNKNASHFVFLLTTRVGGLGVNLTGADRVIIFDPDWNPATDTQARERAWRIGQKNQVTVYRLVTSGTIEEKIYHRQIFKQFLSNKVLKNPEQRRFFKSNDLFELFTLTEGKENSTETSAIFAGTGSEVAVPRKRDLLRHATEPVAPKKVQFSEEKIQRMRELAQRLSRKIADKANKEETKTESEPNPEEKKEKRKSAKHKKKRKGAKFEGERVSNLVKQSAYADLVKEPEAAAEAENQDDYVLRKLFKKSGLQTALKHDKIMDGGGSDYALVEREARHVAQEAVARLRESQQRCFGASEGVPTWTGAHGQLRPTAKRASAALGRPPPSHHDQDLMAANPSEQVSADALLGLWQKRNRLVKPPSPASSPSEPQEEEVEEALFAPDAVRVRSPAVTEARRTFVAEEETELLDELRAFLAFGAAVNGQASTEELLQRFRQAPSSAIKTELGPLFKFLLNSIATFHRDSAGRGLWRLNSEFR